ncbi:hypothetical protein CMO96_04355 [Candidatus Woesebacteria bacterium]|nr:hypothetical protein [Candidatus Woesebacteria bacterium]|tara:strand:+ start:269 stop:454 length:186 start_codon:yes stop_codon:yes gene_type:complete
MVNINSETMKIKRALVAIVKDIQNLEGRIQRIENCIGNEDTLDMLPPEEDWPKKFITTDTE